MSKIINFWTNKSEADKRKIIVYSIAAVVCIILVVLVIAINSKPTENKVADFSNPDAKEVEKYNSRTEANQLGKKDSANLNVVMDDIFGDSQSTPTVEPTPYYEPDYSSSNNSEYQQPAYSPSPSSSGGNGSSNHNQHSTYGDYSMWQAEEPKNNSVGYTNTKGSPTTTKKRNTDPAYTEIPTSTYQEPTYQTQTKDLSQGKQIRAKLISQGYATPGRSLSFVLLEASKIGNTNIAKGQVITGVSSEENNRLMVNFSSIKVKNKIVPVQMQLFGSDGMAGLPVSGTNSNNAGNEATSRGKDIVRDQVNRIPVIGGIISSAVGSGNRTADNKIKLSNNIECIIVNYN